LRTVKIAYQKRAFAFFGAKVFDNPTYHKLFESQPPKSEKRFETGELDPENAWELRLAILRVLRS
jgi:hypothetical protein